MEIETLYGNRFIVRNQKTSFYQKKMNVFLYLLMNGQWKILNVPYILWVRRKIVIYHHHIELQLVLSLAVICLIDSSWAGGSHRQNQGEEGCLNGTMIYLLVCRWPPQSYWIKKWNYMKLIKSKNDLYLFTPFSYSKWSQAAIDHFRNCLNPNLFLVKIIKTESIVFTSVETQTSWVFKVYIFFSYQCL